jgi:hypothetical protein
MLERQRRVGTLQIVLDSERRIALDDVKNGALALLGMWIAYFVIINAFIQKLDQIVVPIVDLPLGVLLVAQGGVLYLLLRDRQQGA